MKKGCLTSLAFLGIVLVGMVGLLLYHGPTYGLYLLPPTPKQYAKAAFYRMNFGMYVDRE